MSFWTLNRRVGGLVVALALCLGLVGCVKSKVTKGNFEKITNGMAEQEVTAVLGEPTETVGDSGGEVGGLGAAAGIDMGPAPRLPKGMKNSVWQSGDKRISIQFKDGKVTKAEKVGF